MNRPARVAGPYDGATRRAGRKRRGRATVSGPVLAPPEGRING